MLIPLTSEQQNWVDTTLSSMSTEEMVGQLLCPENRKYTKEEWLGFFDKVPLGNIFYGNTNPDDLKDILRAIQDKSRIPVTVAADMEQGVFMGDFGTNFCRPMAIAAGTDAEKNAYTIGRILATEARSLGIHWTYAPVVDINFNHNNPVTNNRAFSDDPDTVSRLLIAAIKGRQDGGVIAATAKHFPGDGVDDRDQHLCTSVNSMPMEQWRETYGKVWKAAIEDAGVMSIMSGHISLPAYQGFDIDPQECLPATISKKLQTELLRNELGFDGVIVSDAAPMIGLTSRCAEEDIVVENIISGSDVYLFADPIKDFERLMKAVKSKRLREERVYEAAKRVLEMKARLNIHTNPEGESITEEQIKINHADAQTTAQQSITISRNNGAIPAKLKKGAKVLTITATFKDHSRTEKDLEIVDEELKKRGFEVDHLHCPTHNEVLDIADNYDMIFLNFLISMHMKIGTIRLNAEAVMPMWRCFYTGRDNVICTSFSNPYTLYEQPHLPNMIETYCHCDFSQRAAVKVWLGEEEATGTLPIRLPKVEIKPVIF